MQRSYDDLTSRPPDRIFKLLLHLAFKRAIDIGNADILDDIIMYSKEHFFNLHLTPTIIKYLVNKKMYTIITLIINSKAVLFKNMEPVASDEQDNTTKIAFERYIRASDFMIELVGMKDEQTCLIETQNVMTNVIELLVNV